MHVLVVGASRGSGAAAVRALAAAGHAVTGYARSAPQRPVDDARYVAGDVMDARTLATAMVGQDAVVVALGISDNPIGVRLLRRAGTPLDVRSAGTARVIAAMAGAGVRRLVVQTTYGIGDTYARLPLSLKLFFSLVIAPQVRDSERQEQAVRRSGLDWTVLRPVVLDDSDRATPVAVRDDDSFAGLHVSRSQVAGAVAGVLDDPASHRRTLTVSAA